jgi:hypothetical protein
VAAALELRGSRGVQGVAVQDRDQRLSGLLEGAPAARAALRRCAAGGAGLDELVIHLIPVLLDDGKRLFDRLGGRVDLERTQVVEAPEGVTHLRFRVIR